MLTQLEVSSFSPAANLSIPFLWWLWRWRGFSVPCTVSLLDVNLIFMGQYKSFASHPQERDISRSSGAGSELIE